MLKGVKGVKAVDIYDGGEKNQGEGRGKD